MVTYIRENSRFSKILAVNLLVFIVLFIMSELAYRGYRDGFPDFIFNMVSFTSTPYSNLGTNNWVVYDKELGFRLNPDLDEVNSISVKQAKEIAIPKLEGVFRAIFLGDSVTFDQPGFVSLIRDRISEDGAVEVINASTPGYTS